MDQFTQHLSVLCRKNIVRCRVVNGQTYYSLRDPAFGKVLEALREYFLNHLTESIELLREERNGEQPPLEAPREGGSRTGEAPGRGESGPAGSR